MSLFHCDFKSQVLGLACSMDVIIPQNKPDMGGYICGGGEYKYPVVYLLHGMSDDHTCWQRYTSVERYADEHGFAVVMPAVNRSYYANMKTGQNYWDYVSQEIPEMARQFFNISEKKEDNFVAGLSMGGYGTMKFALTYPERFAAAASFSGALDMASRYKLFLNTEDAKEYNLMFGSIEELKGSENDLFALAEGLAKIGKQPPRLYQWCGTEDFLYKDNINFKNHIKGLSIDLLYEESPGDHSWKYWDEQVKKAFEWFKTV